MPRASEILLPIITHAQMLLAELLAEEVDDRGVSEQQYVRYLNMQYHLTRGVQKYFLAAAAHESLCEFRKLRKFLFDFANEEELHYLVAENDLIACGAAVGEIPLDVALWHAYFGQITPIRPFARLGAAAVLENISAGAVKPQLQRALSAKFLNRKNTKFIVLHQHETLPHGDQILDALDGEDLTADQLRDLGQGAQTGTAFYLRMAEWAISSRSLSHFVRLESASRRPASSKSAVVRSAEGVLRRPANAAG